MYVSDGKPAGRGRRNLHEQIAFDIGVQIARGDYREGDLLPTEMVLAERYGVSRTAVREAFRILAAKGMTTSRPKIGTRVRMRGQWNMLDQDVLGWHVRDIVDEGFMKAVFEMRSLIEPQAAALAAERRSDKQLRALHAALQQIQRAHSGDGLSDAILQFHEALLDAACNPLLRSFGTLIESVLKVTLKIEAQRIESVPGVLMPTSRMEMVARHTPIFEAVRDREPDAARAAVTAAVVSARNDLAEVVARQDKR
ncbi:FadR/GntR family transcriptional regulator [Chthonobacter albigriseus]|uniref:FadR/GntR family transcriptional regulator n=1 Tax=Chthonobacter albigriseus TaxID=1683161 RepID=UPI0015EEFEF3|nr:FadR/GntR family transcriptional regulator [Chthonobacter albigriseus]